MVPGLLGLRTKPQGRVRSTGFRCGPVTWDASSKLQTSLLQQPQLVPRDGQNLSHPVFLFVSRSDCQELSPTAVLSAVLSDGSVNHILSPPWAPLSLLQHLMPPNLPPCAPANPCSLWSWIGAERWLLVLATCLRRLHLIPRDNGSQCAAGPGH